MDQGLLRRLANLCKTYYSNRTIDDLFLYAGAERSWWTQVEIGEGERVSNFYGWIEGIKNNAPSKLNSILSGVAREIAENPQVPDGHKTAIEEALKRESERDRGIQLEPFLSTLVRVLAHAGHARVVAVVAHAEASLEWIERDRMTNIDFAQLILKVPYRVYVQLEAEREKCEQVIQEHIDTVQIAIPDEKISRVTIAPALFPDEQWRERALRWLSGSGVNNQGRVRSDNIASLSRDGLQFRSNEEIHLYNALKAAGVTFAPLPVFLRGGREYRRIEPDFVIIKSGVVMLVEVDGDTVHHESPAEADARTTLMENEGVHVLHVRAAECRTPELASSCAKKVLERIASLKEARR